MAVCFFSPTCPDWFGARHNADVEDIPLPKIRISTGFALCAVLLAAYLPGAARAADPAETLNQAITLFKDGDYLAAQELLLGLNRGQLPQNRQEVRDDYVERCRVAITLGEKALRDLEDAETAMAEHEYDRAEHLLNGVMANEYAPESLLRAARADLRDLGERSRLVEDSTAAVKTESQTETGRVAVPPAGTAPASGGTDDEQTARARDWTAQAEEHVRLGHYAEADRTYREALRAVPGYPEAVEGLARSQRHAQNAAPVGGGDSLLARIRREDAINWQRSVTQYRDVERGVRNAVLAEQFKEANLLLIRGRQIVESGKQYADPVTKYSNLRGEYDALQREVREDERSYNERMVAETRREIEEARAKRLREIDENRTRQVDALMQQALQHRKDGDLSSAVNVLKQVTVIAPRHAPARWLLDILEDERLLRKDREIRNEYITQTRGAILDVHENMIPWYDEIRYSDEWPEIISRKERRHPGEERRDILLLSALDRRVPVDFRRTPLDQAIEHFAQADRLNIIVNWHDLDRAGIDRKTEVDLSLPNEITLKKALTEVLDQAGAGKAELGFDVDEGVINIATRRLLDKKTFPVIYDINDLLMEIPQFTDAPMTDLRDATAAGERRIRRSADRPWQYGDDDDDEPEPNPEHSRRVRKIIHLIEETVAPDSWRDRGGSVGSMQEINGQLVVTQNSASHRQISGLLDKLREERAIQVSVEALFITVSSHYLEEMGINLDIILNAGSAGLDFLNGGGAPLIDPVLGNRLLLPRSFSRLGAVPTATNLGQNINTGAGIIQPFLQPFLVPPQSGGSGSRSTPIPILSNILEFSSAASLSSDVPGSFAGSNIAPALSIFGSFLDNIQVDFLVRATQADSRSSVLTAPRLVVFNGGSAWIAVTIQQNFVRTLLPVVATGAVAVQPDTQTIDAGATLFVRATVTADRRYIMMLIAPGVTRLLALQTFAFSGGTGAGQAFVQLPTLSSQRIQTMVSVPDGGTLLIGGQKLASEAEVEAGVPILSKIPILKRLYSSRSMVKDEQVLLILVKPKILIHSEQEEIAFPSFTQR